MKKLLVMCFLVVSALGAFHWAISAQGATEPVVGYPVPGNPHYVAVESPGRVWFTLPDHDVVGRLVVTSTTDYEVMTYTTLLADPYDLAIGGGKVWFTALTGNAIGCLDPATGVISEFPLPTQNSQPSGIDVIDRNPTHVWFAQRGGDALGQLVVTSTVDYQFHEYPLPSSFGADAALEDVYIQNADSIWFTAPGLGSIGRFKPSYWSFRPDDAFALRTPQEASKPWSIDVDGEGYPWFTDMQGDRLGKFFPQTLDDFNWYQLPASGVGIYDLVIARGYMWFTERDSGKVGRLDPDTGQFQEFSLPHSRPLGLDADSSGGVWIADGAQRRILTWRAPYFRVVYLPLLAKQ